MRTKVFYRNRLNKYFDEMYSDELKFEAAFYNDPAPNQWLFILPSLKTKVLLTCDDDGVITEQRRKL